MGCHSRLLNSVLADGEVAAADRLRGGHRRILRGSGRDWCRTARWSPACRSGRSRCGGPSIGRRSSPACRPTRWRPTEGGPRSLQPTPVPWSAQILQIEHERRARRGVHYGLQSAFGERIQPRAAAVADDDLVAAVVLGINSQGGQRHWACRRDLHVGVGPARGGDADDSIDAAVPVLKLPDPQRVRTAVAVEVADLPFEQCLAGGGVPPGVQAAAAKDRAAGDRTQANGHQDRHHRQHTPHRVTPGPNGTPRSVRPAPRTRRRYPR